MNIWKKIYEACIILIAFCLPSGIYIATLTLLIIAGFCWIVLGEGRNLEGFRRPAVFLPILFYFYLAAGFFFSEDRGEALSSLSVYLPFVLYPVFIGCSSLVNEKLIYLAEQIFLYSSSLFLAIAVGYAFYDVSTTHETMLNVGEGYYNKFSSYGLTRVFDNWHPTYVALFANHSIIILIRRSVQLYNSKQHLGFAGLIALFLFLSASIFLLNSMIGIVVYIIIVFYFTLLFLKRTDSPLLIKGLLTAVFITISLTFIYFNPFRIQKLETLKDKQLKITDEYWERNLLTMRLAIWDANLGIVRNHLLLGTTRGDIRAERKTAYTRKGFHDLAAHNYNAHNQFIEFLSICGIPGFLLFLSLFLIPPLDPVHRNFVMFLVIVAITSLTESFLERQQGLQYFMYFFSMYSWRAIPKPKRAVPAEN